MHAAKAFPEVVFVERANAFDTRQEWSFHNGRKHRDPMLIALPLPYHDLIAAEVNVLDSESETLQQSSRLLGQC
jgi:hypothetical protein